VPGNLGNAATAKNDLRAAGGGGASSPDAVAGWLSRDPRVRHHAKPEKCEAQTSQTSDMLPLLALSSEFPQ